MAYVVRISGGAKVQPKVININGSDDQFYRYKMRQLFVQVVGKGKMIKTMFLNIDDVAKDLKVPPSYLAAYMGYEIGAQSKYDGKKPDRERGSMSGEHDPAVLSSVMKKFIDELVLCPNCKLPECAFVNDKKTGGIALQCSSCGGHNVVTEVNEKFKRFMVNHPEIISTYFDELKQNAAITARASSKAKAQSAEDSGTGNGNGNNGEVNGVTSKDEDDGVEWFTDTTQEAVEQRIAQLPDKFKAIVVTGTETADADNEGDSEENQKNPVAIFKKFLSSAERSNDEIVAEAIRYAKEIDLKSDLRAKLLFEAFFDTDIVKQIPKRAPVLKKVLKDEESKLSLLRCMEKLCDREQTLFKKIPLILKAFYDKDVIDEDTILKWNDKPSRRINKELAAKVRKSAEPFITWLKTAEEDDDED